MGKYLCLLQEVAEPIGSITVLRNGGDKWKDEGNNRGTEEGKGGVEGMEGEKDSIGWGGGVIWRAIRGQNKFNPVA